MIRSYQEHTHSQKGLELLSLLQGFPGDSDGKQSACHAGDPGSTLGWEDRLEKGMATHSRILA